MASKPTGFSVAQSKRRAIVFAALFAAALPLGCKGSVGAAGSSEGGGGNGGSANQPGGIPVASRVPRLTHAQYDNTIQDLFGDLSQSPSNSLPPEAVGSLDDRSWNGYKTSAAALARAAVSSPAIRAHILPCEPAGDEAACAAEFIQSFGSRAFRRDLTEAEVTRFTQMFADRGELTAGGTFDEGLELLLEGFLQSPSFLTRAELSTEIRDGKIPLSNFEMASRLSYTLWNSMPDDVLMEAARKGELTVVDNVRAQALRMLKLPRARSAIAAFHSKWLHMEGSDGARWSELVRDPVRFPQFTEAATPYLKAETLRFIEHVVFEKEGGFQTLLTDNTAFVNAQIAPLYGLPADGLGAELTQTSLDASQRPGLFTRVGFLAAHAMADRTSPILRGAYIQKHVLCRKIGAPLPGAEMTPLPQPGPGAITTRERVTIQTSPEECDFCHKYINPAGFPFENYDAVGTWRTMDNGAPVDASGSILFGTREVAYEGPLDFSQSLSTAPEAHTCYAKQWVEFAYGRRSSGSDVTVINTLGKKLANPDYSILDLLVDITVSESFRNRAPEVSQ